MEIYSLTYFLNWLGYFTDSKSRKMINFIVIALLIFISGTRYYMGGSDVYVYESVYNGVPTVDVILRYMFTGVNNGVNENYETGFLLVCSLIKSLGFSYFGFTLIFATFFYVIMYIGLQEFVVDWAPFWAIFMYKIMFYDTFISIRQGMTMVIFCFSLKYIRDKKWVQYFLCCFAAYLMHRGAILLFLVYFAQYIPVSKKTISWTALLFLPTWLIRTRVDLGAIIEKVIDLIGYSQKSEGWAEAIEPISLIHTLECYIIIIIVLLFYDKIISNKKSAEVKLSIQLMMLTIPIFTLLSNWIVMTREKDYFVMMYGVIFGYILDGRTTTSLEYNNEGNIICNYGNDSVGIQNARIVTFALLAACFIGMTRYVMVFDGGVLRYFTSFITQNVSIFR